MQESFTRHFQSYGNAAVMSPALLFTIARNALVDYLRSRNKTVQNEKAVNQLITSEEESLIAREEFVLIKEAINQLPKPDRDIFTLAVNGVAYKEIASIFNLSIANIKVKVHRSRTRLRQILTDEAR